MFWVRSDLDSGKNFNFGGGGGVLEPNSRTGVLLRIWLKKSGSLACLCITDSLSHTMYVETNETIEFFRIEFYRITIDV